MSENDKSLIELEENEAIGEVKIADEVVATIAALAATEVPGVASLSGNPSNEMLGKLGMKNLNRGVRVSVEGETSTLVTGWLTVTSQ